MSATPKKGKCNERKISSQTQWLNGAAMTAGGVEDTALQYKCEMYVAVKKTTYVDRQKLNSSERRIRAGGPARHRGTSSLR
ncbi:hypothetical protein [Burkholderia sp. HI2500]|uniref:hypothetical protein n=1 Tax=Burkholderia sp. HI2500 TaxID=2015358 RepID=UPI00117FA667|nr:hypothetical protein [Burkholderia sp. HI2500]